jgi:AcrR family transcriptional regulator
VGDVEETRRRIVRAAYACVARSGFAATTLEAAAQEAGVARATVYRYFPGGRDELIDAVVTSEVAAFFGRLRQDVAGAPDFPTLVERVLLVAHRRLEDHEVLQHALEVEADRLLPPLASVMPIIQGVLRDELAAHLAGQRLRPGVAVGDAADLLSRMLLSFMGTAGSWDLDDPAEVSRLVRTQLLAGILADSPAGVDVETK